MTNSEERLLELMNGARQLPTPELRKLLKMIEQLAGERGISPVGRIHTR